LLGSFTPFPRDRLMMRCDGAAYRRNGCVDVRLTESHPAMRRQMAIATAATLYAWPMD
jgi:hypothetical protein